MLPVPCSKDLLHLPFSHVNRFGSSEATFVHVRSLLERKQIKATGILYTPPILVTRIPMTSPEHCCPIGEQGRLGSLFAGCTGPFRLLGDAARLCCHAAKIDESCRVRLFMQDTKPPAIFGLQVWGEYLGCGKKLRGCPM
jgi:hypothetical protein